MILTIKDLSIEVRESKKCILKEASLAVQEGQIFVLIGESGSGKSMMIKTLMGIINRKNMNVTGNVFYAQQDLLSLNEKERRKHAPDIALIMQNPMTAFNPSMRIGKQMTLNLSKKKVDLKDKAKQALQAVNLDAEFVMNAYPHELSGGMLQRVMIAIALMSDAKILIADEPTTALDVITQEYVLDEFLKLKKEGKTLFLVTHDFYVAKKIADCVGVIKNGTIIESGTIDEVFQNPKNEYTKLLIDFEDYYSKRSTK